MMRARTCCRKILQHQQLTNMKTTIDSLKPYCYGFTKEQLEQAADVCDTYGLHPIRRQIHFEIRDVRSGDSYRKAVAQTVTIDGFRSLAEQTGEYEGQTPAQWCGKDGVWRDVWLENEPASAARVGVYRKGFREPLYAVAKWESYSQTDRRGQLKGLWEKMPDLMLAKCAEALALRKAFPGVLGGLYTDDEMAQAKKENDTPKDREDRYKVTRTDDGVRVSSSHGGIESKAVKLSEVAGAELENRRIEEIELYRVALRDAMTLDALQHVWFSANDYTKGMPEREELIALKDAMKKGFETSDSFEMTFSGALEVIIGAKKPDLPFVWNDIRAKINPANVAKLEVLVRSLREAE